MSGELNMKRIILTPEQAAELAPILKRAYQSGSTIFCQIQRGTWPEQGSVFVNCHEIPSAVSKRLKAWLAKEAVHTAKTQDSLTQAST